MYKDSVYTVYSYQFDLADPELESAWAYAERFYPNVWLSTGIGVATIHIDSRLSCYDFFALRWASSARVTEDQWV
jgi:hypothetical protein